MTESSHTKPEKLPKKADRNARKRDREASEARLLKAAEDVFSKFGFKGATTRMIAKKAGINESLIGRYFDGKMGLLTAIIERYVQAEGSRDTLPYPPQETTVEELLHFARYKFERDSKKNYDFFKIVLSQAIVDPKFAKRLREIFPPHYEPALEKRLQALKQAGKIRADIDIQKIIMGLDIFMFGNIIFQRIFAGLNLDETAASLEDFIRRHAHALEP